MKLERTKLSIGTLGLLGAAFLAPLACGNDARDSSFNSDPPIGGDGGFAEQPECGYRCSRDLKKVLKGCVGQSEFVQAECGPGLGCGVDTCIDACSSAALSKGSIGCGFWTVPPDDAQYGAGACYAAMIANTWDQPATITADYGPDALDISQSIYTVSRTSGDPVYTKLEGPLPPGQVALVFLAQSKMLTDPDAPYCPQGVKPALDVDPIRHGTVKTKAFHLKTDSPVAAYSIFPYGGATSYYPTATLLLPVSAWDKNYITVTTGMFGDPDMGFPRRTLQFIANEDDTQITMRPTFEVAPGNDVAPGTTGVPVTWTINRGQVLQITQEGLASGAPISANKPIGLFGGSPCLFIPNDDPYCDLTQQQIPPFAQWGSEYALVPFEPRLHAVTGEAREIVPWSIIGAVDDTVLTYEPEKPIGAPDRLSSGQVVHFQTDQRLVVRSQDTKHPFYASVYMTGSTYNGGTPGGGTTAQGDPDFVNVVPTEQYLDRYVFFTDYTYPETSLTIVRKKTLGSFRAVNLACAGELGDWKPLGTKGDYEYTFVHLTSGGIPQAFQGGSCGYGRHEATSDGAFAVTVWGWGKDASYGYAGGMGSRPVNDAPAPPVN